MRTKGGRENFILWLLVLDHGDLLLFHLMFFRFRQEKQYLKAISVSLGILQQLCPMAMLFFSLL
jgi:hypothetical protein